MSSAKQLFALDLYAQYLTRVQRESTITCTCESLEELENCGNVVVQFLPLVQFFLNQYKIFEPVQNFLNQYKIFWTGSIFFVFVFGFASDKKKIVLAPSIFILPLLFISTLLTSLTIPSLLSQYPSLYSFYLNAYLVSLKPQTFGFPLDSCPDALPLSHEDLDASSPMFLITYTQ